MKRKFGLFAAVLLVALLSLTACGGNEFSLMMNEDGSGATVEAKTAKPDSMGMAGTIEVGKNQKIVVTPSEGAEGELLLEFFSSSDLGEDATVEQLESLGDGEPIVTMRPSTAGPESSTIPAGEYMLKASAVKKLTGTFTITVEDVQ